MDTDVACGLVGVLILHTTMASGARRTKVPASFCSQQTAPPTFLKGKAVVMQGAGRKFVIRVALSQTNHIGN